MPFNGWKDKVWSICTMEYYHGITSEQTTVVYNLVESQSWVKEVHFNQLHMVCYQ